jgi:hypothetical protein
MKYLLIVIFVCTTFLGNAQKTNVEKSIFGVQTGLLGIWGFNEFGLSNNIALRSEIGFDSGIWGGTYYEKTGFIITPVVSIEPRLYYNLTKRVSKLKSISNNSGNFISLKTSFHPDWFVISNYENLNLISDVSIIPTWGIRRNIGKHFNYETGIGLGYRYFFAKKAGYAENDSEVAWNLHLRIGYSF